MDVSGAASKLADISKKVDEFVEKINERKNRFTEKLEKSAKELEDSYNSSVNDKVNEMNRNKKLATIEKDIEAFKKDINDKIKDLTEWYNKQVNSVKKTIIKAQMAKMGIECTDDMAESSASMIPSPSVESMIPKIDVSEIVSSYFENK